ncbi:MAG: insulinase family protein [Myxococcota bacterium]|nr:insulinase family protein [Deltaproteobacteria bacterium]MDQ3336232.1 insulinase family protein [Myxococcota bacterium]
MKRLALLVLVACGGGGPKTTQPAPTTPTGPDPVAQQPAPPVAKPEGPMQPTIKVVQPAAPQELAFPEENFRADQPKPGAPRPFRLPKVKPFTLANGIKVFLVEQHTLPIVSMDLNFDGGALVDPKGKEGLASVCMSMLTEGTQKLDKIQYAEALADVASNINAYAADDSVGLAMSSLTKHMDTTFALFVETLQSPGFRATDFDRMVKRRIEGVKQSKGNPASVAGRVTGGVLYGLEHPSGTITTEASLAAITLDDCKQFATTWLKPGTARLFVVGDLTEAQVRKYFDKGALASWKGKAGKLPALPNPATMNGRIFFVHVPGAAQSQVMFLQFGPKRTAPDYFANTMVASVFGGSFSSRINMNLREGKGYSYGARGGFGYSKQYGTFNAAASVRTDSTYQTLLEIDREIKDLQAGKTPIKLDELDREKQGAILGLPGRFATAQAALGQYRGLVYFGLPLDYYNAYVAKVGQVNEAQVKAAAAKHLKPANAVYIVVGDGDAKMIVRDPGTNKDVPYMKDGKQLTLREALSDLAQRGDVGTGGFIELDTDGRPLR